MMLASGRELAARFVLVRLLGRGGSGEIWLARDRERGKHVALQILAPEIAGSASALAAIEASCARLRELDHPNLLRICGLNREGELAWIAMEHVEAGDLGSWRGRPVVEILRPAIEVAGALAALHEHGIVHRDVKPSNVLLGADGGARLADFGASLRIGEVPGDAVTLGSPYSASPDQLAGAPASVADDVYAFGVLLYELLTGYPPFYPQITPERVRSELPAPPATRHPAPEPLRDLVMRCLAKDPDERPRDLARIRAELESLHRELRAAAAPSARTAQLAPPVGQSDPIRPAWQRPTSAAAGPSAGQLRSEGFRRGLLAAAALLLVIAAAVVFLVLPQWVERGREAPTTAAPTPAPAPAQPQSEEPVDYAEIAKLQREAEELRAAIDPRMQALAERGVERWGTADHARAVELLKRGDTAFAAREYAAARDAFAEATGVVDALEARAPQVLADTLARGDAALADGSSDAAADAFELALELDPENARGQRGAARAATLDEVLGLVTQAAQEEQAGNLAAARDAYARAVDLDGAMKSATEGLARVENALADAAYRAALARGFASQANGDRAAARRAFEEAQRMRPNAAEPGRALNQLAEEIRTDTIAAKLADAGELESDEEWQKALDTYREILKIDPTVAFAQQGVARTEPRLEIHKELELYLTQPERLFSAPVRAAARDALARAEEIPSSGPRLERQQRTLSEYIARAETPVQVALVSDNATRVTIYRIGELGTFETRSLELMPGKYTVVGTRPGFRDVRRELTVVPGHERPTLEIRCEERI